MVEISFPRLEQPVNDEEWKSITLGIGDGVLDERGNPYNLVSLSNVSNTGVIAVDTITKYNHAILKGFYHKMDAPITVSFPPVSAETTYNVALVYDPLNQSMPVSLKVLTSMPRTSGKEYLLLWQVIRKPNQLLTEATIKKIRPTIVPSIQVDSAESLPPYEPNLFGTRAYCLYTGEEYMGTFSRWKKVSAGIYDPWELSRWKITNRTGGIVAQPVNNGFLYTWGASLTRTADGFYVPTSFDELGATCGIAIPTENRPDSSTYFPVMSNNKIMEGRVQPDGAIQLRSRTGSPEYIGKNDAFSFQVSWWTAEGENYIAR
ncbi:hypothetical protein [uncultured Rothia sp.]|uniref:hypothetical protein n=1 Tax=uncultured Rothia sp. TaxID=316088 RepID=UPI003216719D